MQIAHEIVEDARVAGRSFLRTPVFTLLAVLTLAIGIGGVTALAGVMQTVFRGELPFGDADRLMRLRSFSNAPDGVRAYNMPPAIFAAVGEGSGAFDGVVAQRGFNLSLPAAEGAETIGGIAVTAGWADVLQVRPVLGRVFTAEEEQAGRDAGVALISYALWQRRFGGDPGILQRTVQYDGGAFTVVGVMPAGFRYPYDSDLWMPTREDATDFLGRDLNVVGRLRDGVTLEQARADLARVHATLQEGAPGVVTDNGVQAESVRQDFIRDHARTLQALLAAVVFLLLLACANVANLMGSRFLDRSGEFSIRSALGAGRHRLMRQLVTETTLLFLAGGAAGILVALLASPLLTILIPDNLRTEMALTSAQVDIRVGAAAMLFSFAAALLFGLVASHRATKLNATLIGRDARGSSPRGSFGQDALAVAQLGLCIVLLVGAAALILHFQRIATRDPGYDTADVMSLQLTMEQERYAGPEARSAVLRELERVIGEQPGVSSVGVTTVNPLCCGTWGARIEVEGHTSSPDAPLLIHHGYVTPGYFATMGIRMLRGADAAPGDVNTVVVDSGFVARFFPGTDPIGRRVRYASEPDRWRTITGVVATVEKGGDYTESWYLPYYQDPTGRSTEYLHIMVRSAGPLDVPSLRAAIATVDPAFAVQQARTLADLRAEVLAQDRFGAIAAALFAAFGIILAAMGLYGLLSARVQRRRREIGTRIALGATRCGVIWLIVRQSLVRTALGALAGVPLGIGLNSIMRSLIEGMPWVAAPVVAGVVGFVVLVATVSALLPATRASGIPAATVLRG